MNPSCSDILHGVQSYAEICGLAALSLLLMVDRSQCCKHFFLLWIPLLCSHRRSPSISRKETRERVTQKRNQSLPQRESLNYAGEGSLSQREISSNHCHTEWEISSTRGINKSHHQKKERFFQIEKSAKITVTKKGSVQIIVTETQTGISSSRCHKEKDLFK